MVVDLYYLYYYIHFTCSGEVADQCRPQSGNKAMLINVHGDAGKGSTKALFIINTAATSQSLSYLPNGSI